MNLIEQLAVINEFIGLGKNYDKWQDSKLLSPVKWRVVGEWTGCAGYVILQ